MGGQVSNIIKSDQFTALAPRWEEAGGEKETFVREVAFTVQHVNKSAMLQRCSRESLLQAVYNVALTGLTLNPALNHAYLVPRYNSKLKATEAVLEPGYQGLIHLSIQEGACSMIEAHVVYENDHFEWDNAAHEKVISHKPVLKDRGEIVAVYSIATMPSGQRSGEVMMLEDIEGIRKRSESWKAYKAGKIPTCIWVTDQAEMWRKTVIKRHTKFLPKKQGTTKLAKAIMIDNDSNGFRPTVTEQDIAFIETMEAQTIMDDVQWDHYQLTKRALKFHDEAQNLIEWMRDLQPDRIDAGMNYNQGDIKDKLEKHI